MTQQPGFQIQVDQNEYLPAGGTVVDAVITVSVAAPGDPGPSGGPRRSGGPEASAGRAWPAGLPSAAQVVIVDCSGSMTGSRLAEAKRATEAAIDTLRDGVAFAVVCGADFGTFAYPRRRGMTTASRATRAEAKQAVRRLQAGGGTAMGAWLRIANDLFADQPAEIKHAILLTDGKNQHETAYELSRALDECRGRFACDSRGVGSDWVAAELRAIAEALLGTADGLADPAELAAEFQAMTEAATGKRIADAALRLWTPSGAVIRCLKQVFPQVTDLTERRAEVNARTGDYPTGAWGDGESRDYHLSVEAPTGEVGAELLAARVSVVVAGEVMGQQLVRAVWTEDTALSTRITPQVAHYTGQAELAAAIQEGLVAKAAGDEETATVKLGRAVRLATESGHDETAKLLAKVVDVVDADAGTVRLKRHAADVDAEIADVRSVKTVRVKKQAGGG